LPNGRIPFSGIHLARVKQVGEGVAPLLMQVGM
jgi:hypothetical protein